MKVSEASEARQLSGRWLEKSGKHVGPDFTLKPNTKASSLLFCKTEIKTDIGGKKKRNKRRVYGLLVNGRDLRHYTKQVKSRAGTGNPGSVIVPQYGSSKITVFVWGKNIILKFLGNTK